MKKQDNESLIQELTKRLDWYIMKASDEEFDADEVQTLMKLLDNLKTEEDNIEDELPDIVMPAVIIQPIIENAIIHGNHSKQQFVYPFK